MRERYVLLGLARARAEWFRTISQWATSAVFAVLIMAFIGAAMWIAFNTVFTDASDTVEEKVKEIGS